MTDLVFGATEFRTKCWRTSCPHCRHPMPEIDTSACRSLEERRWCQSCGSGIDISSRDVDSVHMRVAVPGFDQPTPPKSILGRMLQGWFQ